MRGKQPGRERMTKQMSLTCHQLTFDQIRKIAYVQDRSINKILNMALSEFIKSHQGDIEQYDSMTKREN